MSFFEEQSEASAIKAAIVGNYFWAWAKVMVGPAKATRIAYIDLFAGPGRYKSGAKSTPLMVLETAIREPQFRSTLQVYLNDADPEHVSSLKQAVAALPGIETLRHAPLYENIEVGDRLTRWLERTTLPPSLVFFDPWGYKGLSLRIIDAALKDFGSDLIFFFNYNRISMGITNPAVTAHMNALFGEEKADALRAAVERLSPTRREHTIVNAVGESLRDKLREKGRDLYVIPFRFKSADGTRTSHYLFFASKNVRGYEIMKNIMYSQSAKSEDGVASFEYTPVAEEEGLHLLFAYSRPIEDLRRMLRAAFAGRTLTMKAIYERHHVGTPFVAKNYKDILSEMEQAGEVSCSPPAESRQKRNGKPTMGDAVSVKFPHDAR